MEQALAAFGLTRHQYYYRPSSKRASGPGLSPSTHTRHHAEDGVISERSNEEVLERIEVIQCDDDLRCGYKRMTAQLHLQGYEINHKKVYRLMRDNDLLLSRLKRPDRPYVQQRKAMPTQPLTLLEMDIKMIWVEEHRRYAFVLTILDTFTRVALFWQLAYHMQWPQVKSAWQWVIEHHLQPADMLAKELEIEVRCDNGPQFIAQRLRQFFADNHLCQVFTHPYTPQENGHIESFHAILATAIQHEHFWTLQQVEARLLIFYDKYNNYRVHSATAHLPPNIFWKAWQLGLTQPKHNKRKRATFILKVPRYQLSGILKTEGASRSDWNGLNAHYNQSEQVNGAVTLQPSV